MTLTITSTLTINTSQNSSQSGETVAGERAPLLSVDFRELQEGEASDLAWIWCVFVYLLMCVCEQDT